MAQTRSNGIDLEYEVSGDEDAPVLLLVSGFSVQLTNWPDGLVDALAGAGFRVVRYDNRDVGLSTKLDAAGQPDLAALVAGASAPPYTLDDMADDAVGLLDALGVTQAHVFGASMGGMIAQLLAIRHADRVLSLTSVMSTTGDADVPAPPAEVVAALLRPPTPTPAERIDAAVAVSRLLWGSGFPFDEAAVRRRAEIAEARCFYPKGASRQFAATVAAKPRTEQLRSLRVPTLVVHGAEDRLIPIQGGERTAAVVPGARLLRIPGMGHSLPEPVWPGMADAVAEVASVAAG